MKKTLFAMLALATMMPAMAENWKLLSAYVDPYENFTDCTKYSFCLTRQDNTDITSVKTMLEDKTFTEFTTTLASGDVFTFDEYDDELKQLNAGPIALTEFSTTININNIWGVCVLQDADVVRFQVLQVSTHNTNSFMYDTDPECEGIPGSGYTSFKADSPVVPEPATATLSLLALAGLATRRKRK